MYDNEEHHRGSLSWWRHQMEAFSALLAICAGNSPVPREFPAQRPVTRSFDVLFDLRLNKRLSKQSWGWWFETLSRPFWRHCNVEFCLLGQSDIRINTRNRNTMSGVVHIIFSNAFIWQKICLLFTLQNMPKASEWRKTTFKNAATSSWISYIISRTYFLKMGSARVIDMKMTVITF